MIITFCSSNNCHLYHLIAPSCTARVLLGPVVTGEALAVVELELPVILGETHVALLQAHIPGQGRAGQGSSARSSSSALMTNYWEWLLFTVESGVGVAAGSSLVLPGSSQGCSQGCSLGAPRDPWGLAAAAREAAREFIEARPLGPTP